ncbi:MAG: hypothetical protein IJ740_15235 [Ruminococcus sp.]|nr:hypothetical protein [Ruminococcus sp.]
MNELIKKAKKHWIVIWLVVAVILFTVVLSYAIYTRVTIAKRVVSTEASAGILFSSDYMSINGMRTTEPRTDDTENASVSVHVFNYAYPKEAVFRSNETQYDLTATIGRIDNNNNFTPLEDMNEISGLTYSVTYNKTNDTFAFTNENQHTFEECTIDGGKASQDLITVVFDKTELSNTAKGLCVKLEAEPYDSELSTLTGYIKVRFSKLASTGWKGELEELDADKDYDGFNYYLEGNGKGKITFRWKPNKVTINKQFLTNANIEFEGFDGSSKTEKDLTADANGYVSLTVKVDSAETNRYEIQFFKVDPSLPYDKESVLTYLPPTPAVSGDWVAD